MDINNQIRLRTLEYDDYQSLAQLVNGVRGIKGTSRALSTGHVRHWMNHPDLNSCENCLICENSGGLVAYALVTPELAISRTVIELGILPEFKKTLISDRLLDWATNRSLELGVNRSHVAAEERSEQFTKIFRKHDYFPVRVYWRMRWSGRLGRDSQMPQGYSIRSLRPGEEAKLAEIQNASFGGQWGFSPNTESHIIHSLNAPGVSPEDILLLVRGEEIAGYCWTKMEGGPELQIGIIGMIGVAPQFRGSGLGRVTLLNSMQRLAEKGSNVVELEVDSENPPARELYASVGFQKISELTWFEHQF